MMDDLFATPVASDVPRIRAGIGGWVFPAWRGSFYPAGLVQRRELEYASRQLTAIEINGTYYGAQKPATYARWRDETPDGFVFSAKAPRFIMQARQPSKMQAAIEDFIGGIAELGDRLGPLLWQFDQGTRVSLEELDAFLSVLPREQARRRLRHVLEVRDATLATPALVALTRRHRVATVFTDSSEYPSFADLSADFAYARLMRSQDIPTGYPPAELARWMQRAQAWQAGGEPDDLPRLAATAMPVAPREVYLFFIGSAKHRNPAAAQALGRLLADA